MKSEAFNKLMNFGSPQRVPSLKEVASLGRHWRWSLGAGLVSVALGAIAMVIPMATALGMTYSLATLLLVAGGSLFVLAHKLRNERGSVSRYFRAVFTLTVGLLVLRFPYGGLSSLALVLSVYFFTGGAIEWILFSSLNPVKGRVWGQISGVASFLIGFYIVFSFPFSVLWVPGLLLGLDLLLDGAAIIGFSFSTRKIYLDFERESQRLREEEEARDEEDRYRTVG